MPTGDLKIAEAFNSMLRTDYIAINDINKLFKLRDYYVDHMNYLQQILAENDQLIIGRRGTGKTTLLYRALIECVQSWSSGSQTLAKPRSLGVYVDLNKCRSLHDSEAADYADFEHAVVVEMIEAIRDQLTQFWPLLGKRLSLFHRVFHAAESKKTREVRALLAEIAELLKSGIARWEDKTGTVTKREVRSTKLTRKADLGTVLSVKNVEVQAKQGDHSEREVGVETETSHEVRYRLTLADILRLLRELMQVAGIPVMYILVE